MVISLLVGIPPSSILSCGMEKVVRHVCLSVSLSLSLRGVEHATTCLPAPASHMLSPLIHPDSDMLREEHTNTLYLLII